MTARFFKSESMYKFFVSPMFRYWIRLHFYPSSYVVFDSSKAFFSVTAGGFTLLDNFSASITVEALTQAYIIREFAMIPIKSGTLNLTFTPSSTHNDSFAFVNGIEIIPVPEIFQPAPMVGFSDQQMETESCTMQTMFRLNIGGNHIPPSNDSGYGRTWYDDAPYIYGAAMGVTSEADKNVRIAHSSDVEKYIAPLDVYSTARSMGPNSTVNINYNLTWEFQIDVNFTYLVRLHFCEYQLSKVNQRVFAIFINNQTAFPEADVIAWGEGKGVPVHKDYAIHINGESGDDRLWVALHPNVTSKPEFYDAILNGLEIFKLNDIMQNLAGPNPMPLPLKLETMSTQRQPFSQSKSKNHGIIIGSVLGVIAGFGLMFGFIMPLICRKRRVDLGGSSTSRWPSIYRYSLSFGTRTSSKTIGSSRISSMGGHLCRHFTLAEIKLGTDNFNETNVIGVGGFGKVYRGYIDGSAAVAIKRANPSSEQGVHEFETEIDLLSKLRHRHLVSLIGACEENDEMILVYDYMANGTLREHLYNKDKPPLCWKQRLDICIGAARGLHYLHTGAKYTIIHRDVKTTNILLDERWVAKVSDFGLSKTGPSLDQTHVSTMVKGSFGYLDPEYFRRQRLTEKSDVYSFGVVLFEVLCGRPAIIPTLPKDQVSLADWALINIRRKTLEEIIDPRIKGQITSDCLKHFTETAGKCLFDCSIDRPSMGSVLRHLEYSLQLQLDSDGAMAVSKQETDFNYAYYMHATLLSIQEEGEIYEESEEHGARR
ncbi:receptor-like protein kinase ANXUR1 [Olea europaea var. sylvestris]|uniref:receptor-like protein kinase ANXUR1 n=1 Tax=Olea europaea var. sylvestris TaxID=158386 RepID=UPI000C1D60EE|nr:receptor-like protein kinase ANXUR1 [Olea europaea var. sylvestris]